MVDQDPPEPRFIHFGSKQSAFHRSDHVLCESCNPPIPRSEFRRILDLCFGTDRFYGFAENYVQTSKYTKWNFLPVNMMEQYRKKVRT
jgi:hypothetical protein